MRSASFERAQALRGGTACWSALSSPGCCSAAAYAQDTHLLDRRRAGGGSGTRRAVQEVGDDAGRDGDGEAGVAEGERDAAGRRAGDARRRGEGVRGAVAGKAGEQDTVVIVLFGHGTFAAKVAKFNLPGPDMTPQDFAPLLDEAAVEARGVREHGQRERTVRRGAVGPGPRHRRGDPHRRRDVRDAVRRAVRRGVFDRRRPTPTATARCRSSKRSITRSAPWRPRTSEKGCMPTEHALLDDNGDKEGSMEPGRQAQGRPVGVGAGDRIDAAAGAAGRRKGARALRRARRRSNGGSNR